MSARPADSERVVSPNLPGNGSFQRNLFDSRLAARQPDGRITVEHLELPAPAPFRVADGGAPGGSLMPDDAIRISGRTFEEIERQIYGWAPRQNAGSRRRAARALAIARSTFCDKARRYRL